MLGDEVFIGEEAVISSNVKVYPFKTVEARAVINSSIVWESKGARTLYGRDGVQGLAGVDMTPEMAAEDAALAFATHLKKDATVVISHELVALGAHAEAGRDGRVQRRWHQRPRPRGLVGARHPLRVSHGVGVGGHHGAVGRRRSRLGGDPLSRQRRRRHPRGAAAQDRASLLPRGLPPCSPRRTSATSICTRALEQYAVSTRVDHRRAQDLGAAVQDRARLRLRRRVARHAQRAREARRRGARGQPVRVDRRCDRLQRGAARPRCGRAGSCVRVRASAR